MKWSWKIGRPFGIDTEVHASFLLLLLIIKALKWAMLPLTRYPLASQDA